MARDDYLVFFFFHFSASKRSAWNALRSVRRALKRSLRFCSPYFPYRPPVLLPTECPLARRCGFWYSRILPDHSQNYNTFGMPMPQKILLAWSGGKDSALALDELLRIEDYEVVGLLTTLTEGYDRVSMHGVRRVLLEQQARSLGLPLEEVYIPQECSDEQYEARMQETMGRCVHAGISAVAFGDLFLEDIRAYRETNLGRVGMKALFPLWHKDTTELARLFIDRGFEAVVTCVDSNALGPSFLGRNFDDGFLLDLPPQVDPCGENGEFHSFVADGPIFRQRIAVKKGEVVLRENRFYFCDLVLEEPLLEAVEGAKHARSLDRPLRPNNG